MRYSNVYMFLVDSIKPSIKHVRNCWGIGGGGNLKCVQLRTGGEGVMSYVYVRTYTISFHVFGSIFVL